MSNRERVVKRAISIAVIKLITDFSLYHSNNNNSLEKLFSLKIDEKSVNHPFSRNNSICFIQKPSIFIASFEMNTSNRHSICAGQCLFGQMSATFHSFL